VLLSQLTGAMSIPHAWGTESDAKTPPSGAPRCTWIPGAWSLEACPFAPALVELDGAQVQAEISDVLAVEHQVLCYCGSALEVYRLAAQLAGWMDVLVGPRQGDPGSVDDAVTARPGYDVRKRGSAPEGGDLSASTWRLSMTVVLKDFVVRRYLSTTAITSAPVQVDAATDTAEQAIPVLAGDP
jgi:hypothetical protein